MRRHSTIALRLGQCGGSEAAATRPTHPAEAGCGPAARRRRRFRAGCEPDPPAQKGNQWRHILCFREKLEWVFLASNKKFSWRGNPRRFKNSIRSGERMGLPSGRPAREALREGVQGGSLRRDPKKDLQKGMDTFFGGIEIRGSLCLLLSQMQTLAKGCAGAEKALEIFGILRLFS